MLYGGIVPLIISNIRGTIPHYEAKKYRSKTSQKSSETL